MVTYWEGFGRIDLSYEWRRFKSKYLAVVFTTFLLLGIILGNTLSTEAKSKKATVTVTVENFKHNEKKLEYKVYKSGTQELLGKKIFAANKIETDEPDFSLNIKYDAKGMHEGSRMDICVHRLSFEKSTYCYYGIVLQVGISPAAMIDISSSDNVSD
jgi:hypothetical protein